MIIFRVSSGNIGVGRAVGMPLLSVQGRRHLRKFRVRFEQTLYG